MNFHEALDLVRNNSDIGVFPFGDIVLATMKNYLAEHVKNIKDVSGDYVDFSDMLTRKFADESHVECLARCKFRHDGIPGTFYLALYARIFSEGNIFSGGTNIWVSVVATSKDPQEYRALLSKTTTYNASIMVTSSADLDIDTKLLAAGSQTLLGAVKQSGGSPGESPENPGKEPESP